MPPGCPPGSSGSPVFRVVPASTPDKYGNIVIGNTTKVVFLGVVAAVYQRNVPLLTTATQSPFAREVIDLGIVYKASTVRDLVLKLQCHPSTDVRHISDN